MELKKFYVFLATGFETVEALAVVDILKRGQIDVFTVSINENREVYSSHDIKVTTDLTISSRDFEDGEGILIPGGLKGVEGLERSRELAKIIDDYVASGKLVTSICAGPAILGHHNLLDGKRATCYPGFEEELYGATYTGAAVEVDGNIITGKGMGKTIEFALEILKHLTCEENAMRVAKSTMFID